MKKDWNIAETEWRVMEELWKEQELTIGEIKARVSDMCWSDSTVKTLVRRLHQKGAIGIDGSKGQFRYYPIVSEEACRKKETKKLVDRLYHGSVRLLMANLVSESKLSEEETEQLMQMIDKMESGDEA